MYLFNFEWRRIGILAIGTSNGTTRLINVAGPSPVELFVSRQAEPVPVVKTLFVETSVPNLGTSERKAGGAGVSLIHLETLLFFK
jgi:hypothetical protein